MEMVSKQGKPLQTNQLAITDDTITRKILLWKIPSGWQDQSWSRFTILDGF